MRGGLEGVGFNRGSGSALARPPHYQMQRNATLCAGLRRFCPAFKGAAAPFLGGSSHPRPSHQSGEIWWRAMHQQADLEHLCREPHGKAGSRNSRRQ
jgi:hypothetical protein